MNRFWLCIDDTDDTTKSIGTGEIAKHIYKLLKDKGCRMRYQITRHQLLLNPAIAYTSHNSSMCMEGSSDMDADEIFQLAVDMLLEYCSPVSHPGVCLYMPAKEVDEDREKLICFGKRAKAEVLTLTMAKEVAAEISGLLLTAPAGNGNGQIGALAGVGLRLYGFDGTIRGKNKMEEPVTCPVAEMKERLKVPAILDARQNRMLADNEMVRAMKQAKLVYYNHEPIAAVRMAEDGVYEICNKAHVYEETITKPEGVVEHCEYFKWDNDAGEMWSEEEGSCMNCLFRRLTEAGMRCTCAEKQACEAMEK